MRIRNDKKLIKLISAKTEGLCKTLKTKPTKINLM